MPTFHPGQILKGTYNYNTTSYYEIISVSASGKSITLRPLRARSTGKSVFDEKFEPITVGDNRFAGSAFRRRVLTKGDSKYVLGMDNEPLNVVNK